MARSRCGTGESTLAGKSPPPTLRLTLLRRLSQLPEDGLNLLRIASVLGSTFSVAELTLLSGQTSAQLLPALTVAMEAGLLSGSGDRLAFHHELCACRYNDLAPAVRKGFHREAGIAARGMPVRASNVWRAMSSSARRPATRRR